MGSQEYESFLGRLRRYQSAHMANNGIFIFTLLHVDVWVVLLVSLLLKTPNLEALAATRGRYTALIEPLQRTAWWAVDTQTRHPLYKPKPAPAVTWHCAFAALRHEQCTVYTVFPALPQRLNANAKTLISCS